MDPDWRCIPHWKWVLSFAMLVYRSVIQSQLTNEVILFRTQTLHFHFLRAWRPRNKMTMCASFDLCACHPSKNWMSFLRWFSTYVVRGKSSTGVRASLLALRRQLGLQYHCGLIGCTRWEESETLKKNTGSPCLINVPHFVCMNVPLGKFRANHFV